jgi:hypothetical protein
MLVTLASTLSTTPTLPNPFSMFLALWSCHAFEHCMYFPISGPLHHLSPLQWLLISLQFRYHLLREAFVLAQIPFKASLASKWHRQGSATNAVHQIRECGKLNKVKTTASDLPHELNPQLLPQDHSRREKVPHFALCWTELCTYDG